MRTRRTKLPRSPRFYAALTGAAVLAVLVGGGAWLARGDDGRLPPRIEIGGIDVGGRSVDEARAVLEQTLAEAGEQPISLTWSDGRLETSAKELGLAASIDEALEEAGTSRNPFSRLFARLGIADTIEIPLALQVDPVRIEAFVDELEGNVTRAPRSARLEYADGELTYVPAVTGRALDTEALQEALRGLPGSVAVPFTELEPTISDAAAAEAKATAEELLEDPPVVVFEGERVEINPILIRRALRVVQDGQTFTVALKPKVLGERLAPAFASFAEKPKNAKFRVRGKKVRVVPGKDGRELSVKRTAFALVDNALAPTVPALFDLVPPKLSTEDAESMMIEELVSEFTTPYSCCQPRVTNIKRAAEILDGKIIPSGTTFSLNKALKERTPERGFVPAPMIDGYGRLVDAVGGGVSQIATTLYNAAFFAGLELIQHTPHSFYISRYPMGREATVSWGGPELIFRNDWPAAILIKAKAEDTSITFRFYSAYLGRRIETETGDPFSFRAARTRTIKNPGLKPGQQVVVQNGGVQGFTVRYTRKVYQYQELLKDERYVVSYKPEDTFIEVGPKKKKKKKAEDEGVAVLEEDDSKKDPPTPPPPPEEPSDGKSGNGEPGGDEPPPEEPPPDAEPPA